jgi:arylsulfatase A-like enzyme
MGTAHHVVRCDWPVRRLPAGAGTAVLLLILSTAVSSCQRSVDDLRAPNANVILVTVDTLRADHLGSYGYSRNTTPNIDAVAERGVTFEAAFSQRGLTFPSIASIMTSKYVYSHGVVTMPRTALAESQETLAETLRDQGFRTVGFTAHLALTRQAGFAQGFDHYFLFHGDHEDQMVERVAKWLRKHRDERFFAWVHFFGPHSPYQPPAPWRDAFSEPDYDGPYDGDQAQLYEIVRKQELSEEDRHHLIALYDGKLKRVDELFGVITRALDAERLRERTLLILTSDHGEELFDHHFFFSHESSVYNSVLHIPLIMSMPGRLAEGLVVDHIVESVDITPTVLDILGVPVSEHAQGRSLLPMLAELDDGEPHHAYGTLDHGRHAVLTVRTDRWRYVYNPRRVRPYPNLRFELEELYDIEKDPDEQHNVVQEYPEVAAELQAEVLRWKAWTESERGAVRRLDDPGLEAQLRALGYVAPASDDLGEDAIPLLVRRLRDAGTQAAREAAAEQLVQVGPEVIPALIELLTDDYSHVRWWAAEGLGWLGPDAKLAVPALGRTLRTDEEMTVRWRAANALGLIGAAAGRSALEEALDDDDENVRTVARRSLQRLD